MAWDDDALADKDTLWAVDEEADAAGEPRPPVVDPAAEEVSPAGDCPGVGVCPVKAVMAKPATVAATRKPASHASASGRHRRRRGWRRHHSSEILATDEMRVR